VLAVLRGHFVGGLGSVDEFVVGKGDRGRGLGSDMLNRFEKEALRRGCDRVVLRAVKDAESERFYRDRGYSRESVQFSYEFGYDYVRLTRRIAEKPRMNEP
jgi:GNAT superfamily N-acetyltransferase